MLLDFLNDEFCFTDMPDHQACLHALYGVFRNHAFRVHNFKLRQICRSLIQRVCAGLQSGCRYACQKFALLADNIKCGCGFIIHHNGWAAIQLIRRHKVDNTVCPHFLRVFHPQVNTCFQAGTHHNRVFFQEFFNAIECGIHHIRHNRGNNDCLNITYRNIRICKQAANQKPCFIRSASTFRREPPVRHKVLPMKYAQNHICIAHINYQ